MGRLGTNEWTTSRRLYNEYMHKSHEELKSELSEAKEKVKVGRVYGHYKRPAETYKVLHLAITEANDTLCVVYQAQYGEKLIFTRPLTSWLEHIEWNGQAVERFSLLQLSQRLEESGIGNG